MEGFAILVSDFRYKFLQIGVFLAVFTLLVSKLVINIWGFALFSPVKDFVIFVEFFSLIVFLFLVCSYFAYKKVYGKVRVSVFGLVFVFFLLLSFLEPWYFLLCIFSAAALVSVLIEGRRGDEFRKEVSLVLIGLVLLPFLTSFAFYLFPVDVGTTRNEFEVSFWAEGVPPSRERVLEGPGRPSELIYSENIVSETDIEILSRHNSKVSLAIHQDMLRENSPAEKVVKKMNQGNVPVQAWLLTHPENYYWANSLNYHIFNDLYDKFIDWRKELNFHGLVLDQELDVREPGKYLTKTMRRLYRTDIYEKSVESYKQLIERISNQKKAILTTWGIPCLDDFLDSDTSLQKMLGVSAVPPETWDVHSFQVYRVIPYRTIRLDLGPYLVYSYSLTAREILGDDVAIGLSHAGYLGYSDVSGIVKDVRLVNALGLSEAQVYSIEQVKRFFGPEGLEKILEEGKKPKEQVTIRYNPIVPLWRFSITFFDLFV
ncbi:hypothetical protein AKJ62_00970 [candidate division MSBL1 archaeon SCGC-AAA259D14]|nr:hypothetical protein AKJ62_00970 [candidate division MSBL1 archaeon SCGC-AAA259D14]